MNDHNTVCRATNTIKAVRIHSFGGPEVVSIEDATTPEPTQDEVLVRVHAAGINPFDWKTREGRLGPLPLPRTLGCDFSGAVEALGTNVTDFFVGQTVFGHSGYGGAFAESVVVPAACLAPMPPGLEDVEAAAIPLCALTAWQALFEIADLQSRQKVLIHGAAGGVGMFAVQLALRQDAYVIATASGRHLAFLRDLGVQQVIDHNATRFEDIVKSVDVVLDLVGGDDLGKSSKQADAWFRPFPNRLSKGRCCAVCAQRRCKPKRAPMN